MLVAALLILIPFLLSSETIITVLTTEEINDLNPFTSRSQVETMLQQIVFPPMMENFRVKEDEIRSEFQPLIIAPGSYKPNPQNPSEIIIFSKDLPVSFESMKRNFEIAASFKDQSSFLWNIGKVTRGNSGNIKIVFEKKGDAWMQGCSIPMVNFDKVSWDNSTSGSNPYKEHFQVADSKKYLVGYPLYGDEYYYTYSDIQLNNGMVQLKTQNSRSPVIEVRTYPNYQGFIKNLNSVSTDEWKVGINISPLTVNLNPNLKFYDQGFTHNYIKVMRFTWKSLVDGREPSGIRIEHIRYIRAAYARKYRSENFFKNLNSVFRPAGFSPQSTVPSADKPDTRFLKKKTFTLQYETDDLTAEMVNIMKEIFKDLGLDLVERETSIIDMNADIVIENIYVYDPEFLNAHHYEQWNLYYSDKKAQKMGASTAWGGNVTRDAIMTSFSSKSLDKKEMRILDTLPIVFLYQYASRIGYTNFTPNRKRIVEGKELRGTPFFFYNVVNWR